MEKLNETIKTSIENYFKSDDYTNFVKTQIEKVIADLIRSSFSYSSDNRKILEDKIDKIIGNSLKNIKLPEYNKFISEIVEKEVSKVLDENQIEHLKRMIFKKLKPLSKEMNISDLFEELRNLYQEDYGIKEIKVDATHEEQSIKVKFEDEFHSITVVFYCFDSNDLWHIGYIHDGNKMLSGKSRKSAEYLDSLARFFFNYYAMDTKFIMDDDFDNIWLRGY